MNTVKIRDIEIGTGAPKIIVPIVGVTKEDIIEEAKTFDSIPIDVVEWRVDWFEGVFDFAKVEDVLKNLREVLGNIPLLMTFRTSKEGGEKAIEPEAYAELNIKAAQTGYVDLVDVEIFTGDDIVEKIIGIISASPDPDHVKMGIPAGFKQAPGSFAVHPGKEIVLGNIIRPHGKNTYAVHLMGKFFTELILSPADPHGTQPDPSFPYIEQLAILPQLYTDGIKRLFPIAVGPPQAGLLYFYFPFL